MDAFEELDGFDSTRSTLQAALDTRWECIAGRSFAVAMSDYPDIQFELASRD